MEFFDAARLAGDIKLYFPRREIIERKQGKTTKQVRPVFPGYLFIETDDSEQIQELQWVFRKIPGFFRFLRSNTDITVLSVADLEIVLHFAKKMGPIAGISKAYFNEQDRIVVTEGPLSGLEGLIIKVDKRKGRAKIKLDFCDEAFTVDLGFEIIEGSKK